MALIPAKLCSRNCGENLRLSPIKEILTKWGQVYPKLPASWGRLVCVRRDVVRAQVARIIGELTNLSDDPLNAGPAKHPTDTCIK